MCAWVYVCVCVGRCVFVGVCVWVYVCMCRCMCLYVCKLVCVYEKPSKEIDEKMVLKVLAWDLYLELHTKILKISSWWNVQAYFDGELVIGGVLVFRFFNLFSIGFSPGFLTTVTGPVFLLGADTGTFSFWILRRAKDFGFFSYGGSVCLGFGTVGSTSFPDSPVTFCNLRFFLVENNDVFCFVCFWDASFWICYKGNVLR